MTNPRLVKYQSASLLIDDLTTTTTTTINDYSSSSSSLSSNTSSTTLSISQEDIFTQFKTELILVETIPQNPNNKIRKIKKIKKKNQIIMTKELAMFKIRRNYNEITDSYVYSLNETLDEDEFNEFNDYNNDNDADYYENTLSVIRQKRRNNNNKTKFKTLIKNNDILSLIKQKSNNLNTYYNLKANINRINLTKCKSRLHLKYNVYSKLSGYFYNNSYVTKMDRCLYKYSNKSIDKNHKLDENIIKTNKLFHKQLCLDPNATHHHNEGSNNQNNYDPPIVVTYSIDHNRVLDTELNQTYDQMYLEFLISLQHRDITPEDYEYLSRLDELVKKKTVNENILKNLKMEQINKCILDKLSQEQCGICLDSYVLDQFIKYLPCGHIFHSECIDSWLKNQSTDCPLDKLPVDGSALFEIIEEENNNNNNEENIIDEYVSILLNDLVDQVCLQNDDEIKCILGDLCDRVDLFNQVENCLFNIIENVQNNINII